MLNNGHQELEAGAEAEVEEEEKKLAQLITQNYEEIFCLLTHKLLF